MLGRKVTGSVEKNYSDKTEDGVTPVTTLLHFPVSDVLVEGTQLAKVGRDPVGGSGSFGVTGQRRCVVREVSEGDPEEVVEVADHIDLGDTYQSEAWQAAPFVPGWMRLSTWVIWWCLLSPSS